MKHTCYLLALVDRGTGTIVAVDCFSERNPTINYGKYTLAEITSFAADSYHEAAKQMEKFLSSEQQMLQWYGPAMSKLIANRHRW